MERDLKYPEGHFIQKSTSELKTVIDSQQHLKDAGSEIAPQNRIHSLNADAERMPRKIHNTQLLFSVLPVEVISEIFLLAITGTGKIDQHGILAHLSPILAVCSFWHEIALHTPRLWNAIVVRSGTPLEMVSLQVARSKSAPLHVFIDDRLCWLLPSMLCKFTEAISLLVPHLYRCHTLDISLETHESIEALFPLSGSIASLRSLTLKIASEEPIFLTLPNTWLLTEIHVEVNGAIVPEVLDIVAHCSALQCLSLGIHAPPGFTGGPTEISIPSLRRLIVYGQSLMKIVFTWNLPHLTHLTLRSESDSICTDPFHFPMLRTLTLYALFYDGEESFPDITFILRNHPCLIAFELFYPDSSTTIHVLETLGSAPDICPQLACLRLHADFTELEPAAQRLIHHRPHIRLFISDCSTPAAFAFRDSHPAHVTLALDGYWPKPLWKEYDIEDESYRGL